MPQDVRVVGEFDYRNARSILEKIRPDIIAGLTALLNSRELNLRLGVSADRKSQDLSKQIQRFFAARGWKTEQKPFSLPELRYDLLRDDVPIEIEIGHERLVYAVFFKFLADYVHGKIPAGVIVVTETPRAYGHTWHNSRESTRRKILAISSALLVPILVIGVDP